MRWLLLLLLASTAQASVTTLTSIASDSPLVALNAAIADDILVGDVATCDNTTTPGGFAVTVTSSGRFLFTGNDSRQSIHCTFTTGGIPHASDLTLWVNNQAPLGPEPGVTFFIPYNSPMTPVDLSAYCSDPEGDAITVTALDALPPGISLISNVLQGIGFQRGIYLGLRFNCADITGASTDWD